MPPLRLSARRCLSGSLGRSGHAFHQPVGRKLPGAGKLVEWIDVRWMFSVYLEIAGNYWLSLLIDFLEITGTHMSLMVMMIHDSSCRCP